MSIITDLVFLRQKSEPASIEDGLEIIIKLEEELKRSAERGRPGVGLAAVQIGILKRVCIIRVPFANGELCKIDLINPVIENVFDPIIFEEEGCLSIPNKTAKTKRFNEAHIKNDIEPYRFIVKGPLLSTCILHEIDHLNGVLFIDNINF